jgi:hypothetical protein
MVIVGDWLTGVIGDFDWLLIDCLAGRQAGLIRHLPKHPTSDWREWGALINVVNNFNVVNFSMWSMW